MPETAAIAANKIILGTMRLHERDRSINEWVRFFEAVYEMGVCTLHSSLEYDSFPLLTEILAGLKVNSPSIKFRHIVKLANPSFDDNSYSPEKLSIALSIYQAKLKSEHIADIQWMWRQGLSDDASRAASFIANQHLLAEQSQALRDAGTIDRFLCFPYTPSFAAIAMNVAAIDGLVVYRNRHETEYDDAISVGANIGKPTIIIRPLNAGKILQEHTQSARDSLHFALDKPGIESAILSSGDLVHLRQLIEN
jgi:hypothetical protein